LGKPKTETDIPWITKQPEDLKIPEGAKAQFKVDVAGGSENYYFTWCRELPVLPSDQCPQPVENSHRIQELTNHLGWNTDTLTIAKVSPADSGNYFCIVTRRVNGEPSSDLTTQTRRAYLYSGGTKVAGITQVASRQLTSSSGAASPVCEYTCNASYLYQTNDNRLFFTATNPGIATLTAQRISGGTTYQLTTNEFSVNAMLCRWPGPVQTGTNFCTKPVTDGTVNSKNTRQFQVESNNTYFFRFGVKNAPSGTYTYKLFVTFP
jgi:hypothetical protein